MHPSWQHKEEAPGARAQGGGSSPHRGSVRVEKKKRKPSELSAVASPCSQKARLLHEKRVRVRSAAPCVQLPACCALPSPVALLLLPELFVLAKCFSTTVTVLTALT